MVTEQERRVAEAMSIADGFSPYEDVEIHTGTGGETLGLRIIWMQRWETYLPESRRFLAAHRAISG